MSRAAAPVLRLGAGLLVAAALLAPARVRAQAPLDAVAAAVAGYWSQGDAAGVADLLSAGGIALHLPGQSHPAAGVRQTRAALGELMGGAGGRARVVRVQELGGAPERGFAELRWDAGPADSRQALNPVIFLGFVREGGAWRIAEIRILR